MGDTIWNQEVAMSMISHYNAKQKADEFGSALVVIGLIVAMDEALTEGNFELLGDMVHGFFETIFD
jgi:hypothetical protein